MKGCTSGFLSKWALRLQVNHHPSCRLRLVSLGLSKTLCVLTLALLRGSLSHSGEKGKLWYLRETLYPLLNTDVFMGNSEYILFVWWGGKRWECKMVIAADFVSAALWLYIIQRGKEDNARSWTSETMDVVSLWLEEMLLCQSLAWLWPYCGPAPLLPQWGWREPGLGEQQHLQSLLPQQEFGSAPSPRGGHSY